MSITVARGHRLARAASRLIGTPFRLHGRDPRHGIDCVGLVVWCLREIGENPSVPVGYRLRNSDIATWLPCAESSNLASIVGPIDVGDIILVRTGPGQDHLVIAEGPNVAIHAHAGLRRVVRQPMQFGCDARAHWRLR